MCAGEKKMGKRVLVVDDAKFMRTMLKNILVSNGYDVIGEADNGKAGFEQYKALHPDVVTMDITMPDYSGVEGLKMIMESDPDAKVIMCSAMGQQAMMIDAMKAGAKDFIIKPFQKEHVIEVMNKLFI